MSSGQAYGPGEPDGAETVAQLEQTEGWNTVSPRQFTNMMTKH